ncbi:hypothetical protein LINGRAHAP2_LOCUS31530 [Linum grandiflorum]
MDLTILPRKFLRVAKK